MILSISIDSNPSRLGVVEVIGKIFQQQRLVQTGVFDKYKLHTTARTTIATVSFAKSFVTARTVDGNTFGSMERRAIPRRGLQDNRFHPRTGIALNGKLSPIEEMPIHSTGNIATAIQ